MNTTELIELARECGAALSWIPGANKESAVFYLDELQQFAQRIEQPHLQRIAELEQQVKELEENLDIEREEIKNLEADIAGYENDEIKLNEKIKQLREALHQAQEDAEIGRFLLKNATEWIRKPYESDYEGETPYSIMGLRLPYDTDLSSIGMRRYAIDQARKA